MTTITYLVGPYKPEAVAAIEETKDGRVLKIFDKDLERIFETSGLDLDKGGRVRRVFPDGNPQDFLRAFETDGMRGLGGYSWMSAEDYKLSRDNPSEWEKELVRRVLDAYARQVLEAK